MHRSSTSSRTPALVERYVGESCKSEILLLWARRRGDEGDPTRVKFQTDFKNRVHTKKGIHDWPSLPPQPYPRMVIYREIPFLADQCFTIPPSLSASLSLPAADKISEIERRTGRES